MKIATWNINGIKARLDAVQEWLKQADPDAVVFQEIKSQDEPFPRGPLEDLGYNVETHGQKGFNGVALLSKRPIEDVVRGLPGDPDDVQARWIEGTISGEAGAVRLCGLYLPNGNPAPGEKYDYKLRWMQRMRDRAADLLAFEEATILLGDFNVIPQAEDAAKPEAWRDDALFLPETREAYQKLALQGWTDVVRTFHTHAECYTFWDFQRGAWQKNNGIRIDHILASPQAADRLTGCGIDKEVRGWERPSDHVPVWCTLSV